MKRYRLLLNRALKARKLGFSFWGTRYTRFPQRVRMLGSVVSLVAPEERGCFADVINVWLDDEYGLEAIDPAPATVVDIGANIGLFSLWAAHTFPEAAIHAYEPNPRVVPLARMNLAHTHATLFEVGVGRRSGMATICDEGASRMACVDMERPGNVPIVSLSEVVRRCGGAIDLLKLDCEGAEWELFEDVETIRRVRHIRMEYHLFNGHRLSDLLDAAESIDFSIDKLTENNGFGIAWLYNRRAPPRV